MEPDLYYLMAQALKEAEIAFLEGEVPVGALVSDPEGHIIARAHNQPISLSDPTAHAEIIAMRRAGLLTRNYRLVNTILVVTVEPCLMCMGAAVNARISRLIFGTFDTKSGAAGSLYNIAEDVRLNHRIKIDTGILEEECRSLMQRFFKLRRQRGKDAAGEVPKWS